VQNAADDTAAEVRNEAPLVARGLAEVMLVGLHVLQRVGR
jgi:hypothetical protein